jgi:hypothetical protein
MPRKDNVVQCFLMRLLCLGERERPEATGEPVSSLRRGVSAKAQSHRRLKGMCNPQTAERLHNLEFSIQTDVQLIQPTNIEVVCKLFNALHVA